MKLHFIIMRANNSLFFILILLFFICFKQFIRYLFHNVFLLTMSSSIETVLRGTEFMLAFWSFKGCILHSPWSGTHKH